MFDFSEVRFEASFQDDGCCFSSSSLPHPIDDIRHTPLIPIAAKRDITIKKNSRADLGCSKPSLVAIPS